MKIVQIKVHQREIEAKQWNFTFLNRIRIPNNVRSEHVSCTCAEETDKSGDSTASLPSKNLPDSVDRDYSSQVSPDLHIALPSETKLLLEYDYV